MTDFNAQRLFVDAPLEEGARLDLESDQANYVLNVLRLRDGGEILVFNGRDGEWRAVLAGRTKRNCTLELAARTSEQTSGPDLEYLFAPLKRSRLDYMVQKAVEMGVARLRPVITRRTIAERVNLDRMRANVIEAAEQCGILRIPTVGEPEKLERAISAWDVKRRLVFCDETAPVAAPLEALRGIDGPISVLIGPEGGFDPSEREMLCGKPFTLPISLGPRVMRADTAAVAALALVNAVCGDWR
jgi:16S rRNA (uracil1498-N3)-methyltransferase